MHTIVGLLRTSVGYIYSDAENCRMHADGYGRLPEMYEYAKKPLALNVEKGDEVVIVTDTKTDPAVIDALFTAATELGCEATVMKMTPRSGHGHDPTRPIAEAMKHADLSVLAASTALAHSPASIETQANGNSVLLMSEVTTDILTSGAVKADYDAMQELGEGVKAAWDAGERVHVTSPAGTDFEADIAGKRCWLIAGRLFHVDEVGKHTTAFPDGEAGITTSIGSTNGRVVFDVSAHHVGFVDEPIVITVEDGWATSIDGGESAREFERYIEENGDENSWRCAAEISIGLNDGVEFTGNLRTDKKKYGTVHVALGESKSVLDGTIEAALHLDGIISEPTVYIDGEIVVEDGEITI